MTVFPLLHDQVTVLYLLYIFIYGHVYIMSILNVFPLSKKKKNETIEVLSNNKFKIFG